MVEIGEIRRILVVDDNDDIVELLQYALERAGYTVATARDGAEALRIARAFVPQVALVDIGLPEMDGCELARRLRADHGASISLVAFTGMARDVDRKRTREAGFVEHLTKPVDIEDLRAVLAKLPFDPRD
jgi:CheY-like chemotaxis protein